MCGIAGFVLAQPSLPRAEIDSRLWAMTGTVKHRGPDDQAVWTDGLAGLAQARLAVIDLSAAANQPIASQNGSVWLTYNGEIYNFAEIRRDLEALGYVFRSRGDAEVIANGWHAWGPRVLDRMRGMFALALWDRRSRRLILARDRLGKKPLYYAPIGAALLFGSEIKALLAWPGIGRRAKTFSIGFPAKEYDETRYARMIAERFGTEHEEFVVEPDAVAVLPRLVWHYGEPFADPSAIPTYYVSQMARRHVTVALNGDGGDEAFLGYSRYRAMHYLDRLDALPPALRVGLARALALAPLQLQRRLRLGQIGDMLAAAPDRPEQRYAGAIAFFADRDKVEGYGEAMRPLLGESALDFLTPYFADAESLLAGANRADLHTYLPDDLMAKVDVASMAHGLETRSPLLDHVLLEWAARIPAEIKMAGGRMK